MMERIETALKEAARSRDGKTITLRLDPMQLGQVKCDVSMRDGLLHARITPQNPDVVHAVREHAHELQTALRRLGLNVDRVSVQVMSEKEQGSFAKPLKTHLATNLLMYRGVALPMQELPLSTT
jgi:flagellar hook-length control protein FliK